MMFDLEFSSIVAIFAGIAALIAYINKRSKRQIKTSSKPFVLKKMPGHVEPSPQGSDLEEWNFPQPTYETPQPTYETSAPASRTSIPEAPPTIFAPTTLTPAFASPLYSGQSYQEIAPQQAEVPRHMPKGDRAAHPRLGTHADLRASIVTMTILGPCRALAPFHERE
jgi:hypothetical protein